ncbi:acyl-CoA dehydrogenase family protein [Seohaeicola saemankumensis]
MTLAHSNTFKQPRCLPVGDIRDALQRLSGTVAEQRAGFDAAGQLPDGLFDSLADLGLFRLLLPARLGGHELSALDFMDVVEDAAALDGSIGWLVGNGGGMGRVGGFLSEASAREIFDDPKAFIVAGTGGLGQVVATDGGVQVSGRWAFGSGAPHGTWFSPVCEVYENGVASGRKVLVYAPRKDVFLHDNWRVSGLCATGSVDFEFRDVLVPDRFVHDFQPEPNHPGTLYRLPTLSIFPWTVATVPLGLARGARDAFLRIASQRKRRGDSLALAERELVQSELGRIDAQLAAARVYLRQVMLDLLEGVEAGADLLPLRVRFRMGCTFASETALCAINRITEIAGAVSILQNSPLERYERDARAAAKHIAMSSVAYINGGKLALGQELLPSGY